VLRLHNPTLPLPLKPGKHTVIITTQSNAAASAHNHTRGQRRGRKHAALDESVCSQQKNRHIAGNMQHLTNQCAAGKRTDILHLVDADYVNAALLG